MQLSNILQEIIIPNGYNRRKAKLKGAVYFQEDRKKKKESKTRQVKKKQQLKKKIKKIYKIKGPTKLEVSL